MSSMESISSIAYFLTLLLAGLAVVGFGYLAATGGLQEDGTILREGGFLDRFRRDPLPPVKKKRGKKGKKGAPDPLGQIPEGLNLADVLEEVIAYGIFTGALEVDFELGDEEVELFGKKWTIKIKSPSGKKRRKDRAALEGPRPDYWYLQRNR